MKILVTGGTGFIGTALVSALVLRGHSVSVVDRNPRSRAPLAGVEYLQADLLADRLKPEWFDGCDAIVHLAGRNIFGTWSKSHKKDLFDSRIISAERIIEVVEHLPESRRPKAIISANAIGYYGDRADEVLTESSRPGNDFLGQLCVQWQDVWKPLAATGTRLVTVRTGIVMDRSGGALQQLLPMFKIGLGTVIGDGRQWFSWIGLHDLIAVYILCIEQESIVGAINAVAPEPIRNKEFTRRVAKALGRVYFLRMPTWALRLAGKDIAATLVASQRVKPTVLSALKFSYETPTIEHVLELND